MNCETMEIIETLPYEPRTASISEEGDLHKTRTPPNAYISIDGTGRLAIWPIGGGWLGVPAKHFDKLQSDVAPFAD